jgi:hypothetical protein
MESTKQQTPSPGENFSQGIHPMRLPHLQFVYRIVCQMTGKNTMIAGVQDTNVSRMVLPIAGGVVSGPNIRGIIMPNSGADWAQLVGSEPKVYVGTKALICQGGLNY